MVDIAWPAKASGLLKRRARLLVYVDGERLPFVLEATTTRGLDQEIASCDIVYPHPLPDIVRIWSRVQVVMGFDGPTPSGEPSQGVVERFVGYVISVGASLWPRSHTIHCEDILAIAKYTYTPLEMHLENDTDISAILKILRPPVSEDQGGCGLDVADSDIGGLGRNLVDYPDVPIVWDVGQTAFEIIKAIDAVSLGYRTVCLTSGQIRRLHVDTDPNTQNYLWHFQHRRDILDGSESSEIKDAKNEITVSGWDEAEQAALPEEEDPFYWRRNSYWIRFAHLKSLGLGFGITQEEVATYILSQINKNIIKVTFSTHLGILFDTVAVVKVTSPVLEVDNHFWVQSIQTSMTGEGGDFTQSLTCVSELLDNVNRRIMLPPLVLPVGVVPGVPITLPPLPPPTAPAIADVLPNFSIVAIDREYGELPSNLSGTGTWYFGVTAVDTSTSRQGFIESRAWTAVGTGVLVETGTEPSFSTAFTDLEGATLTIEATDNHGNTASVTRNIWAPGTPVRARKLYALTDDSYEAFTGEIWRSRGPLAAATVQCVAGGPVWGAGSYVAVSEDDLATAPTEVLCFPGGEQVIALWLHEGNRNLIGAGGSAGSIAISTNRGATWTQKTGLGVPIKQLIISIWRQNEIHVVCQNGWFRSDDQGTSWNLVVAGDLTYLELAPARNIAVRIDGVLAAVGPTTNTPFTGNTSPIMAATAHIRQDSFYAIAADGTTWACEPGSFTLTAREPIPAGAVLAGGAYRDSMLIDTVYYAAQAGGIFKTKDGFRTPEGYLRLRADGRLTP